MNILYSDDSEEIRQYLSTSEGLSNINCEDDDGITPLYYACENNRTDVVDVLIEFGADLNFDCHYVGRALHAACEKGNIDVVYQLLNAGADPNLDNYQGATPIMWAVEHLHLDIVKFLTIYSDFDHTDRNGDNIFSYAIYSNNKEIIDYVFDFCKDINHINVNDWSYLHGAVYGKNTYAISLLLAKGIDVDIQDHYGKKAIDHTKDPEILRMLF